jgi:hypothetical protein
VLTVEWYRNRFGTTGVSVVPVPISQLQTPKYGGTTDADTGGIGSSTGAKYKSIDTDSKAHQSGTGILY